MSQVEEVLKRQINVAEDLLRRAEAIPDGPRTVLSMHYDEKITRPLAEDVDGWEVETTEILRTLFGENARRVAEFQGYVSNKNRYFDFRKDIQSELKKCISYLRSLVRVGEMKQRMPLQNNGKSQVGNAPKIFISHSSLDKEIISSFVEKVLRLGLGLDNKDIAYTSEECMGVEPGVNIARYIKEDIKDASVVLLMVSPNYKKSEVCLNEMGAAWALERKCISVVLPDSDFTQLGWLTSFEKAVRINNREQLLSLYEKIARELSIDLTQRFTESSSRIDDFLNSINVNSGECFVEHTKPTLTGNLDGRIRDAINKLEVFSIRELQEETGIRDCRYLEEKIRVFVVAGILEEEGRKPRMRYHIKSASHSAFDAINY